MAPGKQKEAVEGEDKAKSKQQTKGEKNQQTLCFFHMEWQTQACVQTNTNNTA